MGKRLFYKRFFKRMNSIGMFKAAIYSEKEEYGFPFVKEKYLIVKKIILTCSLSLMVFLLFNPPVRFSKIELPLDNYKISERVDKFGMSVLHRVVIDGKSRILDILIRNGFDLDMTDKYGWTGLHWANFLGRTKIARTLIANGARTDIRSTKKWFIFKKGSIPADVRNSIDK